MTCRIDHSEYVNFVNFGWNWVSGFLLKIVQNTGIYIQDVWNSGGDGNPKQNKKYIQYIILA